MVAVIKTGSSIQRTLLYNERKVKEGVAVCIAAVNYPKDLSELTLSNKLNRLSHQAALNENVTQKSVHISLNFAPSEKDLSHFRLTQIAYAYMSGIGFGSQPYLVYQHHDAGHPHLHIVTVKVRSDGTRIDMQNIGRNQSQKVRKEIESAFGLVVTGTHKKTPFLTLQPAYPQKIQYGKSETKRAIANVLTYVLNTYKYTSLPELNAVLRGYNVVADGGQAGSPIQKNGGLVYRVLDARGNKIGTPIKASDFYNKPTLKYLQKKFTQHEAAHLPHQHRIKNAVDLALFKNANQTLQHLVQLLEKEGIQTFIRLNQEGHFYDLTYVDHHTKCVCKGLDLGKPYSAQGLQERCLQSNQKRLIHVSNPMLATYRKGIIDQAHFFPLSQVIEPNVQPAEDMRNLTPVLVNRKKKKGKRQLKQF